MEAHAPPCYNYLLFSASSKLVVVDAVARLPSMLAAVPWCYYKAKQASTLHVLVALQRVVECKAFPWSNLLVD
jgi:hypothetical protein